MLAGEESRSPAVPTPEALCLSCGFCCDGTIFNAVTVDSADATGPLLAGGIELRTIETTTSFPQPCAAYRGGCCRVYADRPANCRTYRCDLFKKHEAGTVSWPEAQQRIERVRSIKVSLMEALVSIMPGSDRLSIIEIRTLMPSHEALAADRQLLDTWLPVHLRMSVLLDAIYTHFQAPRRQDKPADVGTGAP